MTDIEQFKIKMNVDAARKDKHKNKMENYAKYWIINDTHFIFSTFEQSFCISIDVDKLKRI